jgi:hypothetical protein
MSCTSHKILFPSSNAGGWARYVARIGQNRKACRFLVRMTEGKRQLRKHRLEWEDNINMDLREIL